MLLAGKTGIEQTHRRGAPSARLKYFLVLVDNYKYEMCPVRKELTQD
jgi:hypothetical protein